MITATGLLLGVIAFMLAIVNERVKRAGLDRAAQYIGGFGLLLLIAGFFWEVVLGWFA